MKKQSRDTAPTRDPNAGHDDKRGNGRTAAHPQLQDEEDEYGSGRRETDDYEGDEDIAGSRAAQGREDLEDDSLEGASSRQSRSLHSGRDEVDEDAGEGEEIEEPGPAKRPLKTGKKSKR